MLEGFVIFHFWLFKSVVEEMNGKNSILVKNEWKEMNETRDLKCQEKGKFLCNVLKRKVVRNFFLWGRRGEG